MNTEHTRNIIDYFKDILIQSGGMSSGIKTEAVEKINPNQLSSKILLQALGKIDVSESESALSSYLGGVNPSLRQSKETLIYPFGCNESQKLAVETSFSNSITVVEGPPGTGKTQTILNIIANLIVQNKTVAVVSNNNSAVFNVQEKLQKYGYGMVVASLGSKYNKQVFFDNLEAQIVSEAFKMSRDRLKEAKSVVANLDVILTQCFKYRNRLAVLKTQLADAEIEFSHVQSEQPINPSIKAELDKKSYRKWNYIKALKLKDILSNLDPKKKLPFIVKLRLVLQYAIFDVNTLNTYSEDINTYLNHKFYELYMDQIKADVSSVEKWLKANKEDSKLKKFVDTSKEVFNGILYEKYQDIKNIKFTTENYRKQFDDFINQYPVVLSSTLSLHTSIPDGYLFDYLIIDESSQVDIIKSAVCFSCCRNVVIVGDSMQLTHIIDKESKEVAERLKRTCRIKPAYDYVEQNIINSLKLLYRDDLKSVLLKEHYRCHPTIIGFCNKKYYNNSLVIMTSGKNHPFRIIETNISGERGTQNTRQIDETDAYVRDHYSDNYAAVGVIAPYRKHADILQKQVPDGVEADTIHKYQGREKDTIIFNTVKNQIEEFIDNPNLINVAVSRAVKEFIIVKPKSMKLPHGTNIGDLIRYICYTTDPQETIVKGKICSVFDLLYKEYNKTFATFMESNSHMSGSAAEIIINKLLTEEVLLPDSQFSSIGIATEYKLRDLIQDYGVLSEDEATFIKNNSRLDFMLYSKIDKSPILAIEVDGVSFHDNKLQKERDSKKNHILDIIGLPLLRLSTDGHNEKAKIIESLSRAMGFN